MSPNVREVQAAADLLFPKGDKICGISWTPPLEPELRRSVVLRQIAPLRRPVEKPYRPTHDEFCRGYQKQDPENSPETSEGWSLGREAAGGGFHSALIPGRAGLPKGTRNLVLLSLCHF